MIKIASKLAFWKRLWASIALMRVRGRDFQHVPTLRGVLSEAQINSIGNT